MVELVKSVEAESNSVSKRGPKPKLSIEEQVLVTLEYWREYRTYFHIGTSWELSESTIAFLIHKRYIPDPEQLNQQRFKCAAQMREPLYMSDCK